jgi:hypothetical protein
VSRAEGGLEGVGESLEGPEPSSEAETHSKGQGPRSRWRHVKRGAMPSSEAGSFVARCPPLERDGGSLEGYRGWWFGGPLRLFGPWALFVFGLWPVRGDLQLRV